MKLDEQFKAALESAVKKSGGQSCFARKCGLSKQSISKYLNGSIAEITIDSWEKLRPHVACFLPEGYEITGTEYSGGRKKTQISRITYSAPKSIDEALGKYVKTTWLDREAILKDIYSQLGKLDSFDLLRLLVRLQQNEKRKGGSNDRSGS